MKHWVLLFSLVLLLSGCERKKRAPSVDPTPHPESEQKNKAETGQLGWLRLLAESPKKLETLISSSTLWSMFLQNQHQKVLLEYDRLGEIKPMDRLLCARSSVELGQTARILETLLVSALKRALEIEESRPGASETAAWRKFVRREDTSGLSAQLGAYASKTASFLKRSEKDRILPKPATESYRVRWNLLDRLRDEAGFIRQTKRFLQQSRLTSGADFRVLVGDVAFDYYDEATFSLTREFYARKALDCLGESEPSWGLLRLQAASLLDDETLFKRYLASVRDVNSVPLEVQLLTLVTSPEAMHDSAALLAARDGRESGFTIERKSVYPVQAIWVATMKALKGTSPGSQTGDGKIVTSDSVSLTRELLAQLEAIVGKDVASAAPLVARYVDQYQRAEAELKYIEGNYARAAQIRRRIVGTDAYMMTARNPSSSLAWSALEHWKIVEPRAALRYLKELTGLFPNAKRVSVVLRDILSYRARLTGGQTSAGQ